MIGSVHVAQSFDRRTRRDDLATRSSACVPHVVAGNFFTCGQFGVGSGGRFLFSAFSPFISSRALAQVPASRPCEKRCLCIIQCGLALILHLFIKKIIHSSHVTLTLEQTFCCLRRPFCSMICNLPYSCCRCSRVLQRVLRACL